MTMPTTEERTIREDIKWMTEAQERWSERAAVTQIPRDAAFCLAKADRLGTSIRYLEAELRWLLDQQDNEAA